jgi:ABC-2 type transport system permease protein
MTEHTVLSPLSPTASRAATATRPLTRPDVRTSAPSWTTLVLLEGRKSLSTRSGKALALGAVALSPAAATAVAISGDDIGAAALPLGALGMVTVLVLLALGVLSTAGEWTHRTVQTTFLLVPRRGRVLFAKAVAVGLLGTLLAGTGAVAAAGILSTIPPDLISWAGAARAVGVVAAAGAAFAIIGAGVGAAVANAPAALTGLYLLILGVMPMVRMSEPALGEKLDPADAVLTLALGAGGTTQALVLVGWVVVGTVAGAVVTRRRAVA